MATNRYSLREGDDGVTWSITDVFTGWPAVFAGLTMDGMDVEEAATTVDLLNTLDWQKRVLYALQRGSHKRG